MTSARLQDAIYSDAQRVAGQLAGEDIPVIAAALAAYSELRRDFSTIKVHAYFSDDDPEVLHIVVYEKVEVKE